MMKKLVVLMLVVGMASLASAQFTLTGSDMAVGSSQSIGIYNDTAGAAQEQFYVTMTVAGTAGSWNGAENSYAPPGLAGAPGNTYYGTAVDPTIDVWYSNASDGIPANTFGVGTLADFGLDGDVLGTIELALMDFGFGLLDTLTVTVTVPEPLTMTLLGLGGLFLRRKK